MTLEIPGAAKLSADVVSAGIVVGTLAQLLPHIAALLTIIWTLIRIFETDTVRGLVQRARRAPAAPIARDQEPGDGE
jgi:hypothetical protein